MKIRHLTESNKQLNRDAFNKLINSDYSQAYERYKQGHILYKGMRDINSNTPMLMSPIKDRKSKNTKNIYTLWINNHPDWAKYPHRNVICTTNKNVTGGYGERYIVFPKNNTNIGIVPGFDIWEQFEFDIDDVDSMFIGFYNIFSQLKDKPINDISSYKELLNLIEMFDKQDRHQKLNFLEEVYLSESELQYILNYGLYKFFRTHFSPNEFELTSISKFNDETFPDNECWFDSTFIAIPESYLGNL